MLLGLQLADVEIVDPSNADQLYEAHPGAMVAGFVLLAGLSGVWSQIVGVNEARMARISG